MVPDLPPAPGSPEVELLRLALRPEPGEDAPARIAALLGKCGDAGALLRIAEAEGCAPLLFARISGEASVPDALREALRGRHLVSAVFAARNERRLHEAMDALRGAGIPALAFKGPVLGAMLYEPDWAREYEDLDLLVPPRDGDRAEAILRGLGYDGTPRKPPALARVESASDGTRTLSAADDFSVDLHTRLSRADFPAGFDEEGIRARAVEVPVGGRPVPTFAPGDLLHYLCVHGCKDLWRRRIWMGDLARLLHRHPGIDGGRVVAAAERAGTRRALAVGLALAAPLLDGGIPSPALAAEARDPVALGLARRLLEDPAFDPVSGTGSGEIPSLLFRMELRERRMDRLRMTLATLFVPRRTDWEALPVPGWAVPLLIPFRPLRLLWKRGRHLLGGGR